MVFLKKCPPCADEHHAECERSSRARGDYNDGRFGGWLCDCHCAGTLIPTPTPPSPAPRGLGALTKTLRTAIEGTPESFNRFWLTREEVGTVLAALDAAGEVERAAAAFLDQCSGPMKDGGDVEEWSYRQGALRAALATLRRVKAEAK